MKETSSQLFYKSLCDKLRNRENFSFSRWGDGEWNCLLGRKSQEENNIDGHQYFADLGENLRRVLLMWKTVDEYFFGMQPLAKQMMGKEIDQFLSENEVNIEWKDAEIFHNALIAGNFQHFTEALRGRYIVFVGPAYMADLEVIHINKLIEIPPINCWLDVDKVMNALLEELRDKKNVIVLFAASMMSNFLVGFFYEFYDTEHTFIDVGSVFEPYLGIVKRAYQADVIENMRLVTPIKREKSKSKIVLVTCNFGGIDTVLPPKKQNIDYDYFCFTEENTPFPFPNLDNRTKCRYFRTQMHKLLPGYDTYIWIDGRINVINEDFVALMDEKLKGYNTVNLCHPDRNNVWEEVAFVSAEIKKGNKMLATRYAHQGIERDLQFFAEEKMPEWVPLFPSGIFAQRNNRETNEAFDEWWNMCIKFSNFDQLHLSYILWKYDLATNILIWNNIMGKYVFLNKHEQLK